MINLPKVYWTCYVGGKKIAYLLEQKEGRTREELLADRLFINLLSRDLMDTIDPEYRPQMYLNDGCFADFAFSRIGLLMFNQRVVDAFQGELEKNGELYPVDCKGAPQTYYFYRVTNFVKAMDLAKISRHDDRYQPGSTYNSMPTELFAFIPENVADLLAFKDSQQNPARNLYLGQKFVDVAKEYRFTGLHKETFKPIWP